MFRNKCPRENVYGDKNYIAENTGTIPVEQKQPYDKYDIAHNTGTIAVEQKQPYGCIMHNLPYSVAYYAHFLCSETHLSHLDEYYTQERPWYDAYYTCS